MLQHSSCRVFRFRLTYFTRRFFANSFSVLSFWWRLVQTTANRSREDITVSVNQQHLHFTYWHFDHLTIKGFYPALLSWIASLRKCILKADVFVTLSITQWINIKIASLVLEQWSFERRRFLLEFFRCVSDLPQSRDLVIMLGRCDLSELHRLKPQLTCQSTGKHT